MGLQESPDPTGPQLILRCGRERARCLHYVVHYESVSLRNALRDTIVITTIHTLSEHHRTYKTSQANVRAMQPSPEVHRLVSAVFVFGPLTTLGTAAASGCASLQKKTTGFLQAHVATSAPPPPFPGLELDRWLLFTPTRLM